MLNFRYLSFDEVMEQLDHHNNMSNETKLMKTVSIEKGFSTKNRKFFSHTMIELIITVLSMIDDDT